ncbi:MAG: MarR family transcriptional regulator [Bacteroidales bacterium]|jgi:MarR family transcriptional regulator, organic hydroperoxide resistance regulator|nr:MarR Family Transcriptional Regulator [Bacteroidota bacterium]MCE5320171.1 MarR family transcriptional regulator [Bacteroidales bacterium]MDD2280053.1 MarR family transcriptional regulator [Bacteroidales bacterium]MDD4292338.1 MarR family transcriptional regulator [Bacteroidales bacterium]MDD4490895.1 MarR family transcriptional regulator [Bacteroidales bacterium]
MILNKQVGVFLNLVHCKFKQYMNSIFQKHGFNLTPEQFLVMDTLWDEGVLSQQKIADIIFKDKNSVTKLIDALEKKGLVNRISDKSDRRLNQIHITERAIIIKEEITKIALESTDGIIRDIPKEELLIFINVLNKMAKNIDSLEKK